MSTYCTMCDLFCHVNTVKGIQFLFPTCIFPFYYTLLYIGNTKKNLAIRHEFDQFFEMHF